ncbi:DASH family cryptochrome [Salinisphaera hydrothermalis]|uniref:Cryptochrome DASH n=1 Tax=Salinisphaera hydrothermalis (strain C41B8) TaxID=1304275 RepID=A0A084IN54_SALHC|nr:DASH family cryptochrome [Salinisphaera hydrothermalis]KEZ78138.1 DASH family cryptochrome [Salinisphaera hydrothermalis C41B8]
MSRAICWFKNDLRIDDNPALTSAARAGALLAVYCLEARCAGDSAYGAPRMGAHRRDFIAQALAALHERLASLGVRLVVAVGEPEDVMVRLAVKNGVDSVWTVAEIAPEERWQMQRVRDALARVDVTLYETRPNTLHARDELPFELAEMPRVFTRFRRRIERAARPAPPIDPPDWCRGIEDPDLSGVAWVDSSDPPATDVPFVGGEDVARARLSHYLWQTRAVTHYKQTRNRLLGEHFSSKLSPWLASGCLSVRRVADELSRFESSVLANESTYWLMLELRWREFFYWVLARHGVRLFARSGLLDRHDRPDAVDAAVIDAWKAGRTGMPFVDANMRELAATGYMSNRGRQNVASYFIRDLRQDWRWGAAWFEAQLVDYDVASNWGNWANIAGVGTDKRDEGFNVMSQALHYDGEAEYVSYWIPELRALPRKQRHAPWLAEADQLADTGYPRLTTIPPAWRDLVPSASV